MGNEDRAGILEYLAAGYVVEVVMAVDNVLDRLVCDLADLVQEKLPSIGPTVGDRIGSNHTLGRDDKHCLVGAISEDIDIIGSLDPGRCIG